MKNLDAITKQKGIRQIIFDLDQTLTTLDIDWPILRKNLFDTIRTFDADLADSAIQNNLSGITVYRLAIERHGPKAQAMVNTCWEIWELKTYRGNKPNDVLLEFIKQNTEGYIFHLWTSNSRPLVMQIINELGLHGVFQGIITRDDVMLPKPDAEGFRKIHAVGGGHKNEYLMVGDSIHDKEAAESSGIEFIQIINT